MKRVDFTNRATLVYGHTGNVIADPTVPAADAPSALCGRQVNWSGIYVLRVQDELPVLILQRDIVERQRTKQRLAERDGGAYSRTLARRCRPSFAAQRHRIP
jgi:hypothetical protein